MNKQDLQDVRKETDDVIKDILPEFRDDDFKDLKLSPQQLRFCYEYVYAEFDAGIAYQVAYSETDKVKSRVRGKKLLKIPEISKCYNRIIDLVWDEAQRTLPLKLMKSLQTVEQFDIFDFYDNTMRPRRLEDIAPEKRKLINNIEIMLDRNGVPHYTYDLPNKNKNASVMMELLKIRQFTKQDDGEQSDTMKEAREIRSKIFDSLPEGII